MISIVVVLPAPLGPSRPKQMPSGTAKRDARHGRGGGVLLDEIADFEDGRAHGTAARCATAGARS